MVHKFRPLRSHVQVAITILITLFPFYPSLASAHQDGSDNGLNVILHVEPNDVPIANTQSHFEFIYSETKPSDVFNVTSCSCRVKVTKGTKVILDTPVTTSFGNGTQATAPIVFPEVGAYTVLVSGSSPNAKFSSFTIPYSVHVDQKDISLATSTVQVERSVILGVVVAVLIGVAVWCLRRRSRA
jgi:hypothetical protein